MPWERRLSLPIPSRSLCFHPPLWETLPWTPSPAQPCRRSHPHTSVYYLVSSVFVEFVAWQEPHEKEHILVTAHSQLSG